MLASVYNSTDQFIDFFAQIERPFIVKKLNGAFSEVHLGRFLGVQYLR